MWRSFFDSLREGRTGIGPVTLFDTSKYPSKIGAEIRDYRPEDFFDKKRLRRLSRTDQFALIAAEEAIRTSGLPFRSPRRGWSLSWRRVQAGCSKPRPIIREVLLHGKSKPSLLLPFIPSFSTDRIAERFGFSGPKLTVTTACSSSATAIGYGADLIKNGRARVVLCGGSEALSELTFGGFNSLRAMDPSPCKPFDRKRAGMSLGEGAAILVLEDLDEAMRREAKIYAEFLGIWIERRSLSYDRSRTQWNHRSAHHEGGHGRRGNFSF